MKRKKVVATMLTAVLTVGMISGCGGNGENSSADSGDKELTIWTNMEVEVDTIQEIANQWGEESG